MKLSVTIITYNEERNIERCLRSVDGIADEILIVDSFSTDNTIDICKKYHARILQHPFNGYGEQKLYAALQAQYDYILSLDADEEVSKELHDSIMKLKQDKFCSSYYIINILNIYCGKPIKHGEWYPDRHIRLFNKEKTNWIPRSVHESIKLIPDEKPKRLKGELHHYTCTTIQEHQIKEKKYATLNAEIVARKKSFIAPITPYIKGGFRFFRAYILKLGILDGYYGWIIATTLAKSSFLKYKLARIMQKKASS